jgi:two-component system chemotaxis sensor kinase CheA
MAIVDGMIVRVGPQRFIIPTLGIEESVRPAEGEVQTVVHRGEMLDVRGELVPLVRMHRLFGIATETVDPAEGLVMVVGADGKRCGLLVEDLLGQQQVVIKSLGQHLKNIRGVSGACILGDGRVGLILDVAGLIALAETKDIAPEASPRRGAAGGGTATAAGEGAGAETVEAETVEAVEVEAAPAG